ncbi:transmembrane ascorbate-dependent reductase CYB561-like isoform X1 [Amphibalanus amphitrite]|uniref:transmembrane ascorbate-dependent reductase CYB561-like isoform X1 n=1 Tax=Amphibalanus amphitrite TaxID=1232801 RepID=UPI001C921542|nr:transmembrane ascorbate-dependent reductase CYB561-like isoform X1 [Amphibalanus amphitrite]
MCASVPAAADRQSLIESHIFGMDTASDLRGFTLTFSLAEICGALAVILTVAWVGHFRGGFAWQANPAVEFNWHPVLMVTGLIFLYANSALLYRVFRSERKRKLKLAHALLNLTSLLLVLIGLKAVFDSHDLASPPIPNLYSLHSWVGLCAVLLFAMQWIVGFVSFLAPGLSGSLRARYLPWHQFFGMAIFVTACGAAIMGLMEKAFFALNPKNNEQPYSKLPPEAYLINFVGLLLAVFCCLVVFLLSHGGYRRPPQPEDEMLLRDTVID